MIDEKDMIPLLVEASPSFADSWTTFLAEREDEPSLPYYTALGEFARHMCGLVEAGDELALKRIFDVIERLHIEGSPYVKEAATVGLLEDLQNTNLHLQSTSPGQFERYLLPESAKWWWKVRAFWKEGRTITPD